MEWREPGGRGDITGYLARRRSERGHGEEGQEMDEDMDVIGPGPGPRTCSYSSRRELWKPKGIFFVIQWTVKPEFGLNSFGGNI